MKAGMGSLRDIEEHWSLKDIMDTIDYLDMCEDVESFYAQQKE